MPQASGSGWTQDWLQRRLQRRLQQRRLAVPSCAASMFLASCRQASSADGATCRSGAETGGCEGVKERGG